MIAIRPHNDIDPQGNVNCWKYVLVESLLIHWGTGTGTAQTQDVQVSPPARVSGAHSLLLEIIYRQIRGVPSSLGCSLVRTLWSLRRFVPSILYIWNS